MDFQAPSFWILTLPMPETCFVLGIPHRSHWVTHISILCDVQAKFRGKLHQLHSQLWPMAFLKVWKGVGSDIPSTTIFLVTLDELF